MLPLTVCAELNVRDSDLTVVDEEEVLTARKRGHLCVGGGQGIVWT